LWLLIGLEFGIAIISDLLGRGIAYIDSMLGDRFSHASSVRLMQHAAKLDLEHFEDSTFYDKLERARQQTVGRMTLMSQVFSQGQDILTMIFLAGGLIAFNPWLIVLLLVTLLPAFWCVCLMCGYAFARKNFYGKEILFASILGTLMIPPQVIMIPLYRCGAHCAVDGDAIWHISRAAIYRGASG
jgi:ABC-type bacteriocin/lantibiotic exporter with double-glycine peptidase domain